MDLQKLKNFSKSGMAHLGSKKSLKHGMEHPGKKAINMKKEQPIIEEIGVLDLSKEIAFLEAQEKAEEQNDQN